MPTWMPNLYLKFERERTQPSIDLVTRIQMDSPKRIIDIGCGPGNSTNVLKTRWTDAEIIGLDNSEAMLDEAKKKYDGIEWACADTAEDLAQFGKFDIVFSNAAIQWMPNKKSLLTKLYGMLNENGVLAVQVPCTIHMPVRTELEKLAGGEKWKGSFSGMSSAYSTHPAGFYYDILCGLTGDIDIWETDYISVMDTHKDVVKWYSGSGLRPYLDCLKDDTAVSEFYDDYEMLLKEAYPMQSDGKVLFPFTRVFFIARERK